MADFTLKQLDNRTIAIELSIQNRRTVFRGRGRFQPAGEFGPVLRVGISDPAGDFEILLKEREWDGRIESGERFDCDFAVQLDAACMSMN
jgi:hypothetical protein